ncbi:MAG: metal-dependent transcriptional regulator [Firmicutes bacterium]|nr:metal-dependent transcriptional regulator [[Eubacterium] siraeum]MCM1488542.1 metal-dependent transcriptional regulator [Bacillota bacterium]
MDIQRSGEDYLETIYILQQRTGYVRSIDIANEMGYSKPSVSKGMSILRELGYITMAQDGQIKLTKSGSKRAQEVYSRHLLIKDFFIRKLGVNATTAEIDACKVEHVISEETYLRLREFMSDDSSEQEKS